MSVLRIEFVGLRYFIRREGARIERTIAPGERIVTRRGERRRLALSDGSLLSLNENTVVRHDAARHLNLDAGEIFVEVAPRLAGKTAALFTVATPHREVRAIGTKFLVRADTNGTGIAVTQGQVHVSDVGQAFQPDGPSRQARKPDLQADAVRFSTATQDGHRYRMLRYRPNLPGTAKRQRRDWVFLFESSAERDPLLARTQIEIVRTLLANAEHDDTFAVLTAGTQVHAFAPSPQRATPENVAAALAFLEKSHLLGVLDLDAGLMAAAELLHNSEHPVLVHLGCGQPILGDRNGYGFGTQWMMNPYQGYLSGAADITRAQANYYQGIQQAKLIRQNAIRSSLEARRTFIEEANWERDHMPDPEKIRQKALERELEISRPRPSPTDIWSARSLNALLRYFIAQQKEGMRGPNVPLSDEIRAHVNLTAGGDVTERCAMK